MQSKSQPSRELPHWSARAGHALAIAAARVRVIACNSPLNLRVELERLAALFSIGKREPPRFVYEEPPDHGELRAGLETIARELDAEGDIGALFAERARELSDEARICEAAGSPSLWEAARVRFKRRDGFDAEGDAAAATWLAEAPAPGASAAASVRSDDDADPGSLVCRMRRELGQRRLPFRVVRNPNLASLAATGEGIVQIASNRRLSRRDVDRTVLHEIEGHVVPRDAASRERIALFALATARGLDDQEGRALAIERARGFLDVRRRRELALRHIAARAVEARADFLETIDLLARHHAPLSDALRIAARVHRGGGLAREVVYLPALLRVEAIRRSAPDLDAVLARGRIAVSASKTLAPWIV